MSAGMKRVWNAFLAICLAMSMSMTGVFAWADEGSTGAADGDAGSTAYMQIYVKDSADATAQLVKSYTQEQFEALATMGTDSSYQYSAKGGWKASTTSKYVKLSALFDDADVSIAADDTVTTEQYVNDDPNDKANFKSNDTWGNMSAGQFYPNATNDDLYNVEGAIATDPVLALEYGTEAYSSNAAAAAQAAKGAQSAAGCPKLLYGVSADNFNADGKWMGNRLCGNVNRITVTKAAKADPVALNIVTQDFDGSNQKTTEVKQSTIDQLAVEGQVNVQYAGKSGANVVAATKYVDVASLFAQAGIEVADDDSLVFAQTTGSPFAGPDATWAQLKAGKFFPNMDADGKGSAEGAVDVAPVLALLSGTAATSTTAANAAVDAAKAANADNGLRILTGVSDEDFAAGNMAGRRLVSHVDTITITKAKPDPVVFTINDGISGNTIQVKQSTLDKLAQSGQVNVQYAGKSKASVISATSYVKLSDLFDELGISLVGRDQLQFAQTNAAKPFAGPTVAWKNLTNGYFYPNADSTSNSTEGAVAVEPILALVSGTAAISTNAADAAVEAAKAENQNSDTAVRILYGATQADFAAGNNMGGNRFVSNIDTVTINRPEAENVTRIGGESSADTAALISASAFGKSGTVILATDAGFADAMSATGLAGACNAPILLTGKDGLDASAAQEIKRLQATNIIIVGGEAVISKAVEADLVDLGINGDAINRLAGEEAWDTSVMCARALELMDGPSGTAIVASSVNFQDALSISSFAYKYHVPIFLQTSGATSADRALPAEAIEMLTGEGYYANAAVYVPGGMGAVSGESVEGALGTRSYVRMYGEDGYDTSNAIAKYMVRAGLLSADNAVIACGAQSAGGTDSLAGAALAGQKGSVVLLTNGNADMEDVNTVTVDNFVTDHAAEINSAYALGGTYVMPADLVASVDKIITK